MSAKSPLVLSSSPSLPSICSPMAGASTSPRRRRQSAYYRRTSSYSERVRSTRTGSLIEKTLARLRRARARRRSASMIDSEQVVPDLNGAVLPHYHIHGQNIPAPQLGFAALAINPPPNLPPQNPLPPAAMFPNGEPIPNNVNLLPAYAVTVKSTSTTDIGVVYYLQANETFQRVYYDYAAKVDRYVHEIMIMNNGSYVDMGDTPLGIGIVNGQTLIVIAQNPDVNLNTREKHFYIRDHRTIPLRLKVRGQLAAPLEGLYALWGEAADEDPDRLILSYDNHILTAFHTLSDAKIKNEHEVFVLPLLNHGNAGV